MNTTVSIGGGRRGGKVARIIARAQRTGRIKDGLVLCDNCDTPASKLLSADLGWAACGPCVWGEADSFDENDLIRAEVPHP